MRTSWLRCAARRDALFSLIQRTVCAVCRFSPSCTGCRGGSIVSASARATIVQLARQAIPLPMRIRSSTSRGTLPACLCRRWPSARLGGLPSFGIGSSGLIAGSGRSQPLACGTDFVGCCQHSRLIGAGCRCSTRARYSARACRRAHGGCREQRANALGRCQRSDAQRRRRSSPGLDPSFANIERSSSPAARWAACSSKPSRAATSPPPKN